MDKLLFSFINTLNLLLLPNKEYGVSYLSTVQNKLEELEGDYHTFFYSDNIKKLANNRDIPVEYIETIEIIRNKISSLNPSLWNPNDFIEDKGWKDIRDMVAELLKKDFLK